MKIPEMIPYLSSELPKSSSPSTAPESLRSQLVKRVGWLFPDEVDMIISSNTGGVDWEKGHTPITCESRDNECRRTWTRERENEAWVCTTRIEESMEDLEDPAKHSSRSRNLSLMSYLPAHVYQRIVIV